MGFKDLYTHLGVVLAIAPATYAADTTPAAVDLHDYNARMLDIDIGVGGITFDGTNKIEFVLTHCDTVGGTYTAVTQDDVQGVTVATGGIIKSLVAAHATADVTRVGYIGGKGFAKLAADFSGTHGTGTPFCATWNLAGKCIEPVTLPV